MAGPRVEVQITGDTKGLSRAFGDASRSGSSFGSKMASVGKTAGLALAAGIGIAAVATVSFAKAALEAEKSQTMLDAAFRHAGSSAKEQAAAMKAVNDISVKSGLDDEALADSLSRLTQVTGDAGKATEAMGLAADIARGRGMSLEASTMAVTKAALGNVGALKRMGIEIPKVTAAQDALKESHGKATEEQKKAAKAADDLATRQGALAALQAKFGGDAEAYGKTASGAMDRFKVAIENVQEGLGTALLPALAAVAGGVADFLDKFNQAEGAGAKFRVVMDGIKTVAGQAWDALKTAFNAINWGEVWDTVAAKAKAGVSKLWDGISSAISSINWGQVGTLVGNFIVAALDKLDTFIKNVDWAKVQTAIIKGLEQAIVAVGRFLIGVDWGAIIGKMFSILVSVIKAEATVLFTIAKVLGGQIVKGVVAGLEGIGNWVLAKMNAVRQVVADAASAVFGNALAVGKAIVQGVISGMESLAGSLIERAKSIVMAPINAMKGILGIKSPSSVAADEIGKPISEGIGAGIEAAAPKISEALKTSIKNALDAAKKQVEDAKSGFSAAFSTLSSGIQSAFSTLSGNKLTPAEKELKKLEEVEAEKQRLKAVSDAVLQMQTATTNAEYLAGLEAYNAAQLAIRVAGLQEQAAQERIEQNAINQVKSEALQTGLANLQAKLEENKISYAAWHKGVMALLKTYIPNWKQKGAELGDAFVTALESKIGDAAAAAKKLAKAFSVNIKVTATAVAAGIEGFATGGLVQAGTPIIVGERGPELFVPPSNGTIIPNGAGMSASAAGGITINLSTGNVYGPGGINELARQLEVAVQRATSRNG